MVVRISHRHYYGCRDVSGFTDLCEKYKQMGKTGLSRLTVLIGSMFEEKLIREGDVLKYSDDAFLVLWKRMYPCLRWYMVAHVNKNTCDTYIFLYLKGFQNVEPIYEYNDEYLQSV
ncbi:hypothetical protein CBL_04484 [Carabus blaptoides fortunei]